MDAEQPLVSVCILTARREALLDQALASLAAQRDAPPFEVLIGADREPDVRTVVEAHFRDAIVVEASTSEGGPLPLSDKRNLLVERAKGALLLFLDDDVIVPPTMLRHVADAAAEHPECSVFGGPNVTPPASSSWQHVQGAVLGSFLGSGPSRRRWWPRPAGPAREPHLTLCNLIVRRSAMIPFAPGLNNGEECALLADLAGLGHTMWYDPDLVVFHERRPNWRAFARQIVGYGRGRGSSARRNVANLQLAFLLPLALIGYAVAIPILAPLHPVVLVPGAVYASAVAIQARLIRQRLPRARWTTTRAVLLLVAVHFCYGFGSATGYLGRGLPARSRSVAWSDPVGS